MMCRRGPTRISGRVGLYWAELGLGGSVFNVPEKAGCRVQKEEHILGPFRHKKGQPINGNATKLWLYLNSTVIFLKVMGVYHFFHDTSLAAASTLKGVTGT